MSKNELQIIPEKIICDDLVSGELSKRYSYKFPFPQQDEENGNGSGEGSSSGKELGDREIDLTGLSKEEFEKLIDSITQEQTKNSTNGVTKIKLSDEQRDIISSLESGNAKVKSANVTKSNGTVLKQDVIVINRITEEFKNKNWYGMFSKNPGFSTWITNGFTLGKMLGKKLQVRNEQRSTTFTRQKSGKIDKRLLSHIPYNQNVFYTKETDIFNPIDLHITIDASGSMNSGSKFSKTLESATAICVAASMVSNINVSVSFRYFLNHQVVTLIAYDSKIDNINHIKTYWGLLKPTGLTPEGLCFESILNRFSTTNSKNDKYFINFSDGEPYCTLKNSGFSYSDETGIKHTAEQIKIIKSCGFKVLSYFIGSDDYGSKNSFKRMYGKNASFIQITQLNELAKSLNSLFLQK